MGEEIDILLSVFKKAQNPLSYVAFRLHLAGSAALRYSNGTKLTLTRDSATLLYKRSKIAFGYNTKELKFLLRPLQEIFASDTYKELDVRGKTVVDVGASVADSSIYFALNGAKMVYGFEPDRMRYRLALGNIKRNGLSKKIKVFNHPYRPSALFGNASIKIDCEGCEYSLVGELRKFGSIAMEYHRGPEPMALELKAHGYNVRTEAKTERFGMLYARRKRVSHGR